MTKRDLLIIGLIVYPVLFFWGCGRAVSTDSSATSQYELRGGLTKNLDNDSVLVTAVMKKDGLDFIDAYLMLSGDTLEYDTDREYYTAGYDTIFNHPTGNYALRIIDPPRFNDSINFTIPGNITISDISVLNNDNPYGDSIQVTWTASLLSDRYIVGVVLRNSAYTGSGYSKLIGETEGTTTMIPHTAFRPAGELVLGWYYIYVYGLSGSPVDVYNLPFGFSSGLPDSIGNPDFDGSFGAIVISQRDSVLVHDTISTHTYDLRGGMVKNLDNDSTLAVLTLRRDNYYYSMADITIYDSSLNFDDFLGAYTIGYDSASSPVAGGDTLTVYDSSFLNEKIPFTLPDNFAITSISLPDNRINPGGEAVQLQWQTSLQSDGYILGVVLKDSIYSNDGYSEFVAGGVTSVTIPLDAFRIYGDLATGWYYVYVYSYDGSPASTYNLPTLIPTGLADNISELNFTGRFGTIIVTPRDSILVVSQ
jgi:hypothetical protein